MNIEWKIPAEGIKLLPQQVHVWRVELDRNSEEIRQFRAMLAEEEQKRAARFYFEHDRSRFIVGRGMLRSLLGKYLQVAPDGIEFCYSAKGKPMLANVEQSLHFNLSHSGGLALYAIASEPVGIDLEQIRPLSDAEQLAKRFFTPAEAEAIAALSLAQKQAAFLNAWTRKEAYLKATGDGLAGLDEVEVSLIPGMPAKLLRIQGNSELASNWFIAELHPHPDYVAAVAIAGQDWQVCYFKD
ncbi:4'-phosphopantetheinyl transferase family protein [Laspinema olomoucense]|uniref:4'-phosphopantetheinyl transferase family protein n=1 Tax=Laspinema olomoucense TaxID=3231600 RepID=UPI0021BAC150|nr:4'-phosphopantetheinyl transferase superfamily protein [Laspinema sp. D3d]MCT7972079.1 4'-phosphopantetheinyl transferase superfamily protein [Laspinema sp. D3d]